MPKSLFSARGRGQGDSCPNNENHGGQGPLAPAIAATSAWGVWSDDSKLTFSDTGMVNATWAVNGAGAESIIAVAGGGEYFVAGTPIGAVFGANGPTGTSNYLRAESENDLVTDVVITVTFDSAVAAGLLGFAVSDLDSDHVTVTATGATGAALTGTEIVGTATDSAFNFCAYPGAPCPQTAVPTVVQNANDVRATGVDTDTDGSTAWFRPSVAVKTVTFTYRNDDAGNSSSSRYWFAQTTAPLPDTGLSSSSMMTVFALGAALLAAGGLLIARRRS